MWRRSRLYNRREAPYPSLSIKQKQEKTERPIFRGTSSSKSDVDSPRPEIIWVDTPMSKSDKVLPNKRLSTVLNRTQEPKDLQQDLEHSVRGGQEWVQDQEANVTPKLSRSTRISKQEKTEVLCSVNTERFSCNIVERYTICEHTKHYAVTGSLEGQSFMVLLGQERASGALKLIAQAIGNQEVSGGVDTQTTTQ